MNITRICLDLAKSVFQVHAVDHKGHCLFSRALKREKMMAFFQNLSPCLIGMEACASSHFWARTLVSMGHEVKLIAPQFVKPYVKGNKNDANDAEAICEERTRQYPFRRHPHAPDYASLIGPTKATGPVHGNR